MIPDLQSTLLCDDVRQERTGKFILIGLFDSLGSPSFPFRHNRMFLVTRWCSGEGEFLQHTKILRPDMSTMVAEGRQIPVKLPNTEATATNVELFLNVEFHQPGTHWVEILLDGDLKIRFPLRVGQVKGPPGVPPPFMPPEPPSYGAEG
ncbi:MAG: hypothetical protein LBN38_04935 [Verrucomicrobiota bacterium]|jgi:hypothetical protein|nr:hypothetical protein [Verrucomicrobiota bacterium]